MAFTRDDMAAYEQQPQTQVEIATPVVEVAADAPAEELVTDEATPATGGADADVTADGESSADEVDGDTATPSGEPSAATDPPKGSARARIMELVDQRDAYKKFGTQAEQIIAAKDAEIAALKGAKPAATTVETSAAETTSADDDQAPSPEDADVQYDPVKLQQKNAAWLKRQVDKGVEAGVAKALNTDKAATSQAAARKAFDERVQAFEATPEGKDFRAFVANKELPQLLLPARQLIGRDDMGPAILKVLASDVAAAKELATQPVEIQIMRIGEIKAELKLKAKAPAAAAVTPAAKPVVKPKTVSSAPPPPTRVPAGASTQTRSLSDPSLSMEEFVRLDREAKNAERAAKREARLGRR